jgi:hypothetical protein
MSHDVFPAADETIDAADKSEVRERDSLDDQLHEALQQSFDCGDPVALSFT